MTFASDLEKFARKTGKNMDQVVRGTLLTMGKGVIFSSPVDTGRFKGNWQHSTAYPSITVTGRIDNTPRDSWSAESQAAISGSLANVKAGNIEYLTNNLPYAIRLEYGYSDQSPGGMVRIETARFRAAVAAAVRDIK